MHRCWNCRGRYRFWRSWTWPNVFAWRTQGSWRVRGTCDVCAHSVSPAATSSPTARFPPLWLIARGQLAKSSNPQDRGCCRLPCVVCCRLKHLDVSMCRGVSRRMCAKLEDSMELLKSMNQRLIGDEADIIWKDKNSRLLSCRYSRHSIALFYSSFPIDILTL